jgi:hypothetical protein
MKIHWKNSVTKLALKVTKWQRLSRTNSSLVKDY